MKVLLNGLSVAYPISGVGQYTLQLGRSLETLLGPEDVFWYGKDFRQKNDPYSNRNGSIFLHQIQYGMKKFLRKIPGFTTPYHIWRNYQFRSYCRGVRPSLYHETNYVPFSFEYGPTVITVHDLSVIRHPEWHPRERVKYFEKYFLKRFSQADAIITISEFSKKEIENLLNVDHAKIFVTSLGVDKSFFPGESRTNGLPDRYIFFLGNLEPRKNIPILLNAYRSLPKNLRERYPLVIAGAKAWHTNQLEKALLPFMEDEKPIFTGYIPQSVLPILYRGASLFVYPSLYEGFGLPVLEAMASGVPVIASDSTSLPEVVGDAGVLVNPYDVDHLKEAMMELLEDEKKRKEMVEKGILRAKYFSWEECARQTLSVYEKVLTKRGSTLTKSAGIRRKAHFQKAKKCNMQCVSNLR